MQSWLRSELWSSAPSLTVVNGALAGKAPQRTPQLGQKAAPGILAAVALTEVDPGLALRDFERGLRRKGDIVSARRPKPLTVGAVADAAPISGAVILNRIAPQRILLYGPSWSPSSRFLEVGHWSCCTPQQREGFIVSGRYCQRPVSMATCPSSNRRRSLSSCHTSISASGSILSASKPPRSRHSV